MHLRSPIFAKDPQQIVEENIYLIFDELMILNNPQYKQFGWHVF
jgi:hypothetical protein